MDTQTLLLLSLAIGFYMSWNIGANDVANAMGTSVGSGSLTLRRAVILAAVLEFCGAYFCGHRVLDTLQGHIFSPGLVAGGLDFTEYSRVAGMLSSLLAAGVWLQISSYFGWPVSTTHTTVGAIIGFSIVLGGKECIQWKTVYVIASSWVFSPLIGGIFSYLFFTFLRRVIFNATQPMAVAKKITPVISGCFFGLVSCVLLYDEHREFLGVTNHVQALVKPLGIAVLSGALTHLFVRRLPNGTSSASAVHYRDPQVVLHLERAVHALSKIRQISTGEFLEQINLKVEELQSISRQLALKVNHEESSEQTKGVEHIFSYLQIASAAFMAFAHGANDVSNTAGPLYFIVKTLQKNFSSTNISFLGDLNSLIAHLGGLRNFILLWGGLGIVIGLVTWGWRVITTIGRKITELTPTRGFAAEFSCAMVVMLASQLGLPVSTTHTLVGSIVGVGLARGLGTVNLDVARKIVFSWIVTIPMGAVLSIAFFYVFRRLPLI